MSRRLRKAAGSPPPVASGAGPLAGAHWHTFFDAAAVAVSVQHTRDTLLGDDAPRRVRMRPIGRAVINRLQRSPADTLQDLYDPDSIGRSFYKPAEDLAYMRFGAVRAGAEWLDPIGHHRIQIPVREQHPKTKRWQIRCEEHLVRRGEELAALALTPAYQRARFAEATGDWVTRVDAAEYRRLVEADPRGAYAHAVKRMREDVITRMRESGFDTGAYPDEGGSSYNTNPNINPMGAIDTEFIPLSGGASNRQLYLYAHWEQTSKAFYERHHSELAKAAVGIVSDFVLGRGIGFKIRSPKVDRVWREFWKRCDMDRRLRQMCDDSTWQGELMLRKYERPKGFLEIRSLDPGAFQEIVTDPNDAEAIFFYAYNSPSPWQILSTFRGRNLNIPSTRYTITQYPPQELYHLKLNVSATEKWGRSDFFSSFGTLKRHRDWTNASTLKDLLQANLVWKIKVKGDQGDVDAFVSDPANSTLPAYGGTWVENEWVTLEPMHEDVAGTGGRGQGSTGLFLTSLFAAAQNMPVSYFNVAPGGTARATALTQGEPFVKKIATRQQVLRQLLAHLYEEVMQRAVVAGRLAAADLRHEDADPEWVFPSAYEEDRGAKFRDLDNARDTKVISHRSLSTQKAKELGLEEYDYDLEQEQIEKERRRADLQTWPRDSEAAIQLGMQPAGGPPPPPMMQGAAGQGQPTAAGDVTGAPTPGADQPDAIGRGEQIKGADARSDFRRQHQGHSLQAGAPLSDADQRFVETLTPEARNAVVLLPSGRVLRAA